MATSSFFDKSLTQAPMGMPSDFDAGSEIEIEIEDPESVKLGLGGLEIVIEKEKEEDEFNDNLAEKMDPKDLATLAEDLCSDFEDDISSRKDWMQTYVDGLDLLGLKVEDRTEPWPGACGVYHPLLTEAVVKFQAETIMETFPAQGPVRSKIIGEETKEKKESAIRVEADMNHQLTDVMIEYRPEHEKMLWGLGLAGNAFKKVYFDPGLGRQTAMYVSADDLVVPYGAANIETAERVTHVMRKTKNEMERLMQDGFYVDVELEEPSDSLDEVEKKIAEKMGFRATTDSRYKLLEMHVNLDLPGFPDKDEDGKKTGLAVPYVVTIEKSNAKILAIRRNWNPDDELRQKRQHFVHYPYVPGFGFYAFGLIHLVGGFAKSGTSILRQLVDAGTLSNLPGGFKTKGMRTKGDDTPFAPAEWRDVDIASGALKDNIMPLPYKEPSQVLAALMDKIVDEGRRFASAADLKVSDMSAQSPVGTTLAILERTLKVMSAVQARIHYAMKQEFRLLKKIIADYTPDKYDYEPVDGRPRAKKSDYDNVDVIPVSDPNAATMSQKVVQYQAVMQLAQTAPQLYDLPYLHRQMLQVLGIKNAEKLVPIEDDMKPTDPVSENMDILQAKPVKAFIYQDHQAHITVHMAAIQDPKIMEVVGQSPQASQISAALAAHVQEHIAFEYRKQIEEAAGVPYPAPNQEMDESTEVEISRLAAAAAQQVLQKNKSEAAQKQAQQAAQDPIVQMQQKELEIKQQDVQLKQQKIAIDAAAKADQLDIERERIAAQERIAGLQVGVKVATSQRELSARQQSEGMRMGIETGKELLNRTNQQQKPPSKDKK